MPRKQTAQKTAAKTTTRKKTTTSARKTPKTTKRMTLVNPGELDNKIREKAYELYEERGGWHGAAMDDWLRAEREVKRELISA